MGTGREKKECALDIKIGIPGKAKGRRKKKKESWNHTYKKKGKDIEGKSFIYKAWERWRATWGDRLELWSFTPLLKAL